MKTLRAYELLDVISHLDLAIRLHKIEDETLESPVACEILKARSRLVVSLGRIEIQVDDLEVA